MTNENEEDIITPENNDEIELGEEQEEQPAEPQKPVETPEAKRARLKRQLEQLDKKYGFEDKKPEVKPTEPKAQELSAKDVFALAKADVAEEDFDEVINYAKYRNITPAEALKDKTLKTILAERLEERQTALATTTRSARPSAAQTSEVILSKAERGELPTKDEDIDKLAEARMQAKLNQKK